MHASDAQFSLYFSLYITVVCTLYLYDYVHFNNSVLFAERRGHNFLVLVINCAKCKSNTYMRFTSLYIIKLNDFPKVRAMANLAAHS